jgi:hypothetical protein
MIIERICPLSGEIKHQDIPVTQEQLDAWRSGALIQNAMPQLSADEREFIMTGITPDVWEELFAED